MKNLRILAIIQTVICILIAVVLGAVMFMNPVTTAEDFKSTSFLICLIVWIVLIMLIALTVALYLCINSAEKALKQKEGIQNVI